MKKEKAPSIHQPDQAGLTGAGGRHLKARCHGPWWALLVFVRGAQVAGAGRYTHARRVRLPGAPFFEYTVRDEQTQARQVDSADFCPCLAGLISFDSAIDRVRHDSIIRSMFRPDGSC